MLKVWTIVLSVCVGPNLNTCVPSWAKGEYRDLRLCYGAIDLWLKEHDLGENETIDCLEVEPEGKDT